MESKYVVYDGNTDVYIRKFTEGKFVHLPKGVVTCISNEMFLILKDSKKSNRINEVIGIDSKSKKNLEVM
jgi:hypothetical protein